MDSKLEKKIINALKSELQNSNFKSDDLLEWSTSETVVQKGLRDGEKLVEVKSLSVFCAVPNSTDKRS
jgi:hypothetical protein